MKTCYLITGGNGNLARQLAEVLAQKGHNMVLLDVTAATDLPPPNSKQVVCDITDTASLRRVYEEYRPTHVLHFASILSGKAEQDRALAWKVNMDATFALMELAVAHGAKQFFVPSTGATYGAGVADPLPEDFPQWPENLYGVTKVAIERLGNYYHRRHGLDFRCLRLPLVVSPHAPRAAVSAYASHAFVAAVAGKPFVFPVNPASGLSTLYVKDVLAGIAQFLEAPSEKLTRRVYNVHGIAPTAEDIARAITARVPGFTYSFEAVPTVTRLIDSWPFRHEDRDARVDWGWNPRFGLKEMTDDLLAELRQQPSQG